MLEQYAETAYRGKQDAKFRDEIATDERDSMYCRYQSKQAIYPRGKVFGHCFDSFQDSAYKYNLSGKAEYYRKVLGNDDFTLNLPTKGSNITDSLVFFWIIAHLGILFFLFTLPFLFTLFGRIELALESFLFVFIFWSGSKLFNLTIWKAIRIRVSSGGLFHRKDGSVTISNEQSITQDKLLFEEFNAHYCVENNPGSGFPYRGITLLHYQRDFSYDRTGANLISSGFIHWELLQNFMDVTEPLADIPQFEYYREFDKTTAEFDKANGRPKYFWYRVDKHFKKRVNEEKLLLINEFNDEEQLNNLLTGKPIRKLTPPDIFKFPWKYADDIKAESEIKFGKTLWQKFTSFLMIDL